jgi:hypothetical protein
VKQAKIRQAYVFLSYLESRLQNKNKKIKSERNCWEGEVERIMEE